MQAGVAVNPHTPVDHIFNILDDIDVVCLMSVNPGFGGQKFIPYTLEKIRDLKTEILRRKASAKIEIDGGVTLDNAATILAAGADILVAGNTVFGSDHPLETIQHLKGL